MAPPAPGRSGHGCAYRATSWAPLKPPEDNSVAGFVSVGASQLSVTDTAATAYETASLAATAEVFGNATRWHTLVGCTPKADLSDACVTTYIKTFGRAAFRRDLTDEAVVDVSEPSADGTDHLRAPRNREGRFVKPRSSESTA